MLTTMTETPETTKEKDLDYQIKRLMFTMMNAFILFLLSYYVTYMILQGITLAVAGLAGIRGTLFYNEIVFDPGIRWTVKKIIFVTVSGPVVLLAIGVAAFLAARKPFPGNYRYLKMALLWTGFHGINFFGGGIIAGTVTGTGLGYALDYTFFRPWILYLLLDLLFFAGLLASGNRNARIWLGTSPSSFWVQEQNRRKYFVFSALLPWILGSVVIGLLKIPDHELQHAKILIHDLILLLTMGFILSGMSLNKRHFTVHTRMHSAETDKKLLKKLAVTALILLILLRVLLTRSFYSLFS